MYFEKGEKDGLFFSNQNEFDSTTLSMIFAVFFFCIFSI